MDFLPAREVPLALVLLTVVAVVFYLSSRGRDPNLEHIPLLWSEKGGLDTLKSEFGAKAKEMLGDGYTQFKKGPFRVITTEGPRIVLGPDQMEEVKKFPDSILDQIEPQRQTMSYKYTMIPDTDDNIAMRALKFDLTNKLVHINETLAAEVDYALNKEFSEFKDWTPISTYTRLLRTVTIASTRIFIADLCHNEEWIDTTMNYTINLVNASNAIKQWKPALRPFVYRFLPELRRLYKDRAIACRLLKPIIIARRESADQKGYEKPNDMLQWMMDARVKEHDRDRDYQHMADIQLAMSFGAMHTTTMTLTHMIYDLGIMPEYIRIIRDEARTELARRGGVFDGRLMKALKKTDSFMKESQRQNPIGFGLFIRCMKKDYTLSDGTFLPKNSFIMANSHFISNDADLWDNELGEFDGLRYYKKGMKRLHGQSAEEAAGKHQFVSISQKSMMFGYGRHACPGRFFAGNEIKLILVKLLERYDMKLESNERPKNLTVELNNNPDLTKMVLFKSVADASPANL